MLRLSAVTFIIFLFLFPAKQVQKPVSGKGSIQQKNVIKLPADSILNSLTGIVDKQKFTINYMSNYDLYILNSKKEIIFTEKDAAPNFEFTDFNHDGYKDILLHYSSNVPGIMNLLLYDVQKKTFRAVQHFPEFPAAQRIAQTKYYYSYHRSGCADMNWGSDLFYIQNYTAIKIGAVDGYECGDSGIKDGIYISKFSGAKKTRIKQLPIKVINSYKSYKWGFIHEYWNKHYQQFIR